MPAPAPSPGAGFASTVRRPLRLWDNTILDFSISNNGVSLFSRSFTRDELGSFFDNRLLDLGELATGSQNVSISSNWQVFPGDVAGFHYLVGVALAVRRRTMV